MPSLGNKRYCFCIFLEGDGLVFNVTSDIIMKQLLNIILAFFTNNGEVWLLEITSPSKKTNTEKVKRGESFQHKDHVEKVKEKRRLYRL